MTLRVVDDGFDFSVVVLDETWVIRTPRRPSCEEALAVESRLLPALAPKLPVETPRFEHVSTFAVYRLIEGSPLRDEEDGVREFLDALHAFDPRGLDVPAPDWVQTYSELADEFRRAVLPLLDVDERNRADALFAEVDTLTGFEPVLTHSDLGPEHLICRDGRLAGVIDWGDARIGDPALDYAWLLNVPFPHWDVDDDLRRRARFYYRLAPFFGVHACSFTGADPAESLANLRARN